MRKCGWRTCINTIDHMSARAKFCSDACKMKNHRWLNDPMNKPVGEYEHAPFVLTREGASWLATAEDGRTFKPSPERGEARARCEARWHFARRTG